MIDTAPPQATGAENVTWDLTHLYAGLDDPAITSDMAQIEAQVGAFRETYYGRVGTLDATALRNAVAQMDAIDEAVSKISAFAGLAFSTDTADPARGAFMQRVREFETQVYQQIVFFDLEWNAMPEDNAAALLADPVLADFAHFLESQRRYRDHQLSEAEERVMMEKDVVGGQAWTRYFTQLMSSLRYEYDGQVLTQAEILSKAHEEDREVRRKAADSVTATLQSRAMELTYIFNVLATNKAITDRLRGYDTWITSRNLTNKAPESVVNALIDTVTGSYDLVARHYHIKRAVLGYDRLTDYDRYAPLPTRQSQQMYTWQEARQIVLDAFNAFSPEVGQIAARFFDENWIHAAPLPNKRGGAFAHPVAPSVHPYVFLSYTGKARDVMTLAHELGHGLHGVLSARRGSMYSIDVPLTTAEMASTFAEMLVFNDLLQRETDPEAQLSMIASKIEDSFATVYRQVAMNRFEHGMHTARRTEGELTTERFSDIWMQTQQAMFGDSVILRDDYRIWWSYIPHFLHTPGYVYAYAFGELLVLSLYKLYQERGDTFVPHYLDVLEAGNTDYPDRILARLDVDLNDSGFWQGGVDAIRELIDREAALARQLYPERFSS